MDGLDDSIMTKTRDPEDLQLVVEWLRRVDTGHLPCRADAKAVRLFQEFETAVYRLA